MNEVLSLVWSYPELKMDIQTNLASDQQKHLALQVLTAGNTTPELVYPATWQVINNNNISGVFSRYVTLI